jgi:hypothetical protein
MLPLYFSETFIDWILGRASRTDSLLRLEATPLNSNKCVYGTFALG